MMHNACEKFHFVGIFFFCSFTYKHLDVSELGKRKKNFLCSIHASQHCGKEELIFI